MAKKKKEFIPVSEPMEDRERHLPELVKPVGGFWQEVKVGDHIRIMFGIHNQATDKFDPVESTGIVTSIHANSFRWTEDITKRDRGKPWWAIRDWEILDVA